MSGPRFKVGDVVTVHLSNKCKHPFGTNDHMRSLQGMKLAIIDVRATSCRNCGSPMMKFHDGYIYTLNTSNALWSSSMFAETYEY